MKGGLRRQHSCSFHVQNRIPARLRRGFPSRGGAEFKCKGTKRAFLTMTSKATARLCAQGAARLKRAEGSEVVGQVFFFPLPRSGDDYQLLSAQISWNNCQRDT